MALNFTTMSQPRDPYAVDAARTLARPYSPAERQAYVPPPPATTYAPTQPPQPAMTPQVQAATTLSGANTAPPVAPQTAPAAPAPTPGKLEQFGKSTGDPYWDSIWKDQSPEDAADIKAYSDFLYSLPDYKGRNEANKAAIAVYARNKRLQAKNKAGATDYSGLQKLGDENASLQDQLAARLAASGHAPGGGVAGGAYSNLAGKTSGAVSDYLSEQDAITRRENLARELAQMNQDSALVGRGLDLNLQEQNDPGLWGDISGLLGQGLGLALPGIGGALGSLLGIGGKGHSKTPQPSAFY